MVLKFTVELDGIVKLARPYQLAGQSQLGQRADTLIGGAARFLQGLDRGRLVTKLCLAQAGVVAGDASSLLPWKSANNVVELLQQLPQFVRTGQTPPGFDAGAQSPPDKRSCPDPYEVLGVSPQASWEEIKRTRIEILKRVHPDPSNQQLSEGARAFFDEQAKQVGEAFEEIKKLRKIKA